MDDRTFNIVKNFAQDSKKILAEKNVVAQYLFGSFARNEQNEESDVDVCIIVKNLNYNLRRKISELSSDYSLEKNIIISAIIKDIKTWEKNKKYNSQFYQEIKRDGIKI